MAALARLARPGKRETAAGVAGRSGANHRAVLAAGRRGGGAAGRNRRTPRLRRHRSGSGRHSGGSPDASRVHGWPAPTHSTSAAPGRPPRRRAGRRRWPPRWWPRPAGERAAPGGGQLADLVVAVELVAAQVEQRHRPGRGGVDHPPEPGLVHLEGRGRARRGRRPGRRPARAAGWRRGRWWRPARRWPGPRRSRLVVVVLPLVPDTRATGRPAARRRRASGSTARMARPPTTDPPPRPRRRDSPADAPPMPGRQAGPHWQRYRDRGDGSRCHGRPEASVAPVSRHGLASTARAGTDVPALMLRLTIGPMLMVHGYNKVFGKGGLEGTTRWFDAPGPPARPRPRPAGGGDRARRGHADHPGGGQPAAGGRRHRADDYGGAHRPQGQGLLHVPERVGVRRGGGGRRRPSWRPWDPGRYSVDAPARPATAAA